MCELPDYDNPTLPQSTCIRRRQHGQPGPLPVRYDHPTLGFIYVSKGQEVPPGAILAAPRR